MNTIISAVLFINLIADGLCLSRNVTIETHPRSQTVKLGKLVRLLCIFNEEVKCVWKRNGRIVQMQGRYTMSYGIYDPKKRTRNCSFAIKNFGEFDVGDWVCKSPGTSSLAGIDSNIATLSLETYRKQSLKCMSSTRRLIMQDNAKHLMLKCKFNEKVKCSWNRDNGKSNAIVSISGRYRYIVGNGVNTKYCTIVIKSTRKELDEGKWTCSSISSDNYGSNKCSSTTVTVLSKSINKIFPL